MSASTPPLPPFAHTTPEFPAVFQVDTTATGTPVPTAADAQRTTGAEVFFADEPAAPVLGAQSIVDDHLSQDSNIARGLSLAAVVVCLACWWFAAQMSSGVVSPEARRTMARCRAWTTYLTSTISFILHHLEVIHGTLGVVEHTIRDVRDVAGAVMSLINVSANAFPPDANNGTDVQVALEV